MRTIRKSRRYCVPLGSVLFFFVASAAACSRSYDPDIVINGLTGYVWFQEKPLIGTKVFLYLSSHDSRYKDEPGSPAPISSIQTGNEGNFSFGKLKTGYYNVVFETPDSKRSLEIKVVRVNKELSTELVVAARRFDHGPGTTCDDAMEWRYHVLEKKSHAQTH